ncbi:MAG: hypothetical protein JSR45_09355 [Proteobacteria bacterium]|nr:hypothetical protein [Pseudomonadota bacterium]
MQHPRLLPRARALAVAGALLAVALVTSPATAAVERLPDGGAPAFQVTVPDGWTSARDGVGNLRIMAGDKSGALVLNLVAHAAVAGADLDQVAAESLKVAKAEPFSAAEDAMVDGHPGRAYVSRVVTPAGALSIRLVLVRLDDTHLASETELLRADANPAQAKALREAILGIRLVDRPPLQT